MPPSIGNLRPLNPKMLMANTAPNIIGYSEGCNSVSLIGSPDDWQAPSKFRRLSALGPVYRQFYRVQCNVQYPGRRFKTGKPKKVILCWAGVPSKGLRPTEPLPGRPGPGNPVWVSCSCNYFRFVCEWALSRYGSSDIIYSNGQPARFTNPRGVGTLCKHIYKVLPIAIGNWHGEAPESQVIDEDVEPAPQIPVVQPANPSKEPEEPEEVDIEEPEEDDENPKEAGFSLAPSGLYLPNHLVPSRLAAMSQNLRSLALSFDTECC